MAEIRRNFFRRRYVKEKHIEIKSILYHVH